jgi:hypothetical protein
MRAGTPKKPLLGGKIDPVVAPFAAGDLAAIEIENFAQLVPVKRNNRHARRSRGDRGDWSGKALVALASEVVRAIIFGRLRVAHDCGLQALSQPLSSLEDAGTASVLLTDLRHGAAAPGLGGVLCSRKGQGANTDSAKALHPPGTKAISALRGARGTKRDESRARGRQIREIQL